MADAVNLEQAEKLVAQLLPQEQLKLVARICEQLGAMPFTASTRSEAEQLWRERLRLAEELLSEVEDIEDDSQGEFDVVADIRKIREERIGQI